MLTPLIIYPPSLSHTHKMMLVLLLLLLMWLLCLGHARIPPFFPTIEDYAMPPQGLAVSPAPLQTAEAPLVSINPEAQERRDEEHRHFERELFWTCILVSTAVLFLLFISLFTWIHRQKHPKESNPKNKQSAAEALNLGPIVGKLSSLKSAGKKRRVCVIEYPLLEAATHDFSESNILGDGGFGCVYKACFDNNFFAAVKRLDGERKDSEKQFEIEITVMSRIHHPNIVALLGYSTHGQTRFLVYELMQNGSLEAQLHGPSRGSALSWHHRMKIALDIARGIEYLHEHCNPPVIHRDLKSSNVLLDDSNFNAKISDFGLAIDGGDYDKSEIKLSGTLGYVAPEYLLDGKLTDKSDVYAFGVILFELLLGKRSIDIFEQGQCNQSIVTWAMPHLTNRAKLPDIIDPVIRNTMDLKHLYQVAAVAVLCVQQVPSYRPMITDVLHSLVPLVPTVLGGTLRISQSGACTGLKSSAT